MKILLFWLMLVPNFKQLTEFCVQIDSSVVIDQLGHGLLHNDMSRVESRRNICCFVYFNGHAKLNNTYRDNKLINKNTSTRVQVRMLYNN